MLCGGTAICAAAAAAALDATEGATATEAGGEGRFRGFMMG